MCNGKRSRRGSSRWESLSLGTGPGGSSLPPEPAWGQGFSARRNAHPGQRLVAAAATAIAASASVAAKHPVAAAAQAGEQKNPDKPLASVAIAAEQAVAAAVAAAASVVAAAIAAEQKPQSH